MAQKPVLYTPDEANRVLPRLRELLPELRGLRAEILHLQDLCDVEEISSHGSEGAHAAESRAKMDGFREKAGVLERQFEARVALFEELGCELKGLEPGLV